jgi:hypothetical protein
LKALDSVAPEKKGDNSAVFVKKYLVFGRR